MYLPPKETPYCLGVTDENDDGKDSFEGGMEWEMEWKLSRCF